MYFRSNVGCPVGSLVGRPSVGGSGEGMGSREDSCLPGVPVGSGPGDIGQFLGIVVANVSRANLRVPSFIGLGMVLKLRRPSGADSIGPSGACRILSVVETDPGIGDRVAPGLFRCGDAIREILRGQRIGVLLCGTRRGDGGIVVIVGRVFGQDSYSLAGFYDARQNL